MMTLTEAIAVLEAERRIQGVEMLELLIDIRNNPEDYMTNTKAVIIQASEVFNKVGQEFFAEVE